jgi:stage II sporulation protein D
MPALLTPRIIATLTVMGWLSVGDPGAAQSIRVLMSDVAQQVIVAASSGIVVQFEREEVVVPSTVTISTGAGRLHIDGRSWPGERVTVHAEVGDLTVVISQPLELLERGADLIARRPNGPPTSASAPLVLPGRVHVSVRAEALQVINELDLEAYVAGVVPYEMNVAWHPEALKAQSVAARTYALYQQQANAGRGYDVVAGIQDQVYRGRHADPRVQQAVEQTSGLVLMHGGRPILAAFSSTAAGPTEDAMIVWAKDLPYLKGVDCPFDTGSPYFQWHVSFKLEELELGLRRQGIPVGTIATLAPLSYSRTGRVARLRILHSGGELVVRGEELRRAVGYTAIPSTLFDLEAIGPEVVLSGRGAGHAVGLCQWGAKELASLGYSFSSILHYYFPDTELVALQPR